MSGFFRLNLQDVGKGLVMAVIAGFLTPFLIAMQSPDFSIFTANWAQLISLAENGAAIGLVSYLIKNFFSTPDGKVLGMIG